MSLLQGSVPILSSSAFVSPSPSASAFGAAAALASVQVGAGGPAAALEPGFEAGSTTGESFVGVKLAPKRRVSTRRRKRVGAFVPSLRIRRYCASLLVRRTWSFVAVADPARRKISGSA